MNKHNKKPNPITIDTSTGAGIIKTDLPNPHNNQNGNDNTMTHSAGNDGSQEGKGKLPIKSSPQRKLVPENELNLTPRQKRFTEEYLIDLDAKDAVKRAGYSPKSAGQQASTLVINPKIQTQIAKNMEQRSIRTRITADRVLMELACIGLLNVAECFDADGNLKNIHDMSEDVQRALSGITLRREFKDDADKKKYREEIIHIKTVDKLKALELMGRHIGMFKREDSGLPNLEGMIAEARARADKARKAASEVAEYEDIPDKPAQDTPG